MVNVTKEEYMKERIKFLTEYLKILWVVLLAVSGGSAGLFMRLDNPIKALLFLIGVATIILTSSTIVILTPEILRLLDKLKEEGEKMNELFQMVAFIGFLLASTVLLVSFYKIFKAFKKHSEIT